MLVTFLYTQCPDVCPLIATRLSQALDQLGPKAADARLIAVSVDPKGDTPAHVTQFLRMHDLTGRMQYAIGTAAQLRPDLEALGRPGGDRHDQREPGQPLGPRLRHRRLRTDHHDLSVQPQAADVAHDVPVLASR